MQGDEQNEININYTYSHTVCATAYSTIAIKENTNKAVINSQYCSDVFDTAQNIDNATIFLRNPTFVCDSFDTGMTECYRFRYVWPTPDTFVDTYFQNIYGCDSTIRYHVRINVGIDESSNLSSINIYPNPTNDFLYIDYDKNKKLFYSLYDISGKLISDKKIISPIIDVRILDNGIYLLEIKDEEDNCIRKKVIKE